MKTYRAESAYAGLEAAADAGLRWDDFCRAATELLAQAIPFDSLCMGTSDPATNLLCGAVMHDLEEMSTESFVQAEYGAPDYNHFVDLAHRPVGVSILAEATEGKPELSRRYRELLSKSDIPHEMRGALRSGGRMWGVVTLYRSNGRSGFSPGEAAFMHRIEAVLARGLRRGLIVGDLQRAQRSSAAAVVILNAADQVVSATEAAEERFRQLGGDLWSRLPVAVGSVLAAARGDGGQWVPEMRIRSLAGEWLTLHGARVRGPEGLTTDVAVTISVAGPADIIPLVVEAYGLTEREQTVVQQVLSGGSTAEIAKRLHLSPYTVQDHLKAIFDKVNVSSRRELMSRIFFDHYVGRLHQQPTASGWFTE
ncbi:helix-turn-helix transcriptional regulator [Kribbella sandramycini]|uniref:DNA-binding CsgD family transcriptional regulator n=1 Tax=Kribbella sandramycini TaxID=60450 RepID=A0A7Y4P3T2_9ACTN|nr:helix-turn-helix transcriptional regulator [Kribbella sandramycini]MBB6571839.1 DNA-binding CsgD family transcriptional regulator [Kribbella sandramycini]NOL44479.1 helix-turn-helix transcriptional regulator [Kribbella sandramycini]